MKQVVCLSALLIVCMINVAIYGQQDSSLYSRQSFRAKARIKKAPVKKAPGQTGNAPGPPENAPGRSLVASLPPLPKSNTDSSRSRASTQNSTGIRLDNSLLPLSTHVEITEAGQASGAVDTRDELARISSASRPAVLEAPATLAVAASRPDSITLPPGDETNSTESLSSTATETPLAQPLPLKLEHLDEPESTSDLDLNNESDPWYELGQFGLGDSDSVVTSVAPIMDDPSIETVGYSGGLVESNPGYALKTPISTRRARQATRTGSRTGDGRGYSFLSFFKRRLGFDNSR